MSGYLRARLSLMMFLQYFMFASWLVTMGTYLSKGLGFDDIIGTAFGMQGIAAILATLTVGAIADRFAPAQKVMGVLLILSGITLMLLGQVKTSRELFLLLVLAHLMCFVPTIPLSTTIALSALPNGARQFPAVRAVGTVGWIVAGLLVGGMPGAAESNLPFYIGGITGVVLGLYSFTLPNTPPRARDQAWGFASLLGLDILKVRDRNFWILASGVLFVVLPLSFYYAYTNNFLVEANAIITLGGVRFEPAAIQTLGQGAEFVLLLMLPFLLTRMGVKGVLLMGMFAWVARYGLFAYGFDGQTTHMWMLVVAVLLHGVCYDFFFVASQIYIDEQFDPRLRTRAQAFLVFINMGIGVIIGANLANAVYTMNTVSPTDHNWRAIWLIPAGIALVVGVAFAVVFKAGRAPAPVRGSAAPQSH